MQKEIIFQIIEWEQCHLSPNTNTVIENNLKSESNENTDSEDEPDLNDSDEPEEETKPKFEDLEYKIRLFGRTNENKSIHVEVNGYTPFFYVEIPKNWTQIKAMSLVNYIKSKINKEYVTKGLIKFEVVERKKFYGFTGYQDFKFIRFVFKNMMSYKAVEKWIEYNKISFPSLFKNPTKLQLYESNIEPFIRCMHIRNLVACGWVKISKYSKTNKISFCDINIRVDWKDLNPHSDNSIQKFIVASFDIECMSESGNFPQATNDKDQIIQIGTVFSYYGESEPFYKHIVTLGGCEKIPALANVDIESYKSERNVLLAWTKLIQKQNPDIITGYNINGFDFSYMYERAKKIESLTKLPLVDSFMKLSKIVGETAPYRIKELSSSGLGDNLLKYIAMGGRIIIDLMKVAQRDYKLDSFKLDNVAANFIKESIKNKIVDTQANTTTITTTSTYGISVDQYINIMYNDGLTDNKHEDKYKILEINEQDKKIIINGIIPQEIFDGSNKVFWCHAKDDVSPKEMFKLFRGSDKDRAIIAKYCIQDCVLVTKLMEKLQILNNNIGMANVCSVPLSYIFMRGQGAKIFSLVAKTCRLYNHLIPKITAKNKQNKTKDTKLEVAGLESLYHKVKKDKSASDTEDEEHVGYEGATVFPPVKGVHYEPIPVLDYASLYPRSMICINISHECIVLDTKYDNLPDYNYQTVTYKNNDGTTTTCRFAKKKDGTKGILCLILIDLLDKRSATKKLMEQATDKFLAKIYDGSQLAYKVSANGLYGLLGAPTSPIYMEQLAASTTATGRIMLEFSRDFIEGVFGELINFAKHDKNKFYEEADKLFNGANKKLLQTYPSVYTATPEKKFIEPRAKRTTKEDFINYFYDKVISLLKETQKVKPKVIYGDSVTGDMPVLLLGVDGQVINMEISHIGKTWSEYSQFKKDLDGLTNKQQDSNIPYKVWTDKGWAKIIRVIRHKTNKQIYGINTPNGWVKVTEDHSLLDKNSNQLKPAECNIGTELLHNDNFPSDDTIENYKKKLDLYYKIKSGYKSCNCYCIKTFNYSFAMEIYYLAIQCNYRTTIFTEWDDTNSECVIIKYNKYLSKNDKQKNYCITSKTYYSSLCTDYVYDIETEVGHFHAGVGSLIVKNTDSVFFTMKIHDINTLEIKTDKEALGMCIEFGQLAGATICKILPEPEEQVYEKTLWPFIIITKKRYVGNLYETDVNKYYQKSMGIVLKRRDNAKIVKIVVGGIVNYILNERSNRGAIDYTKSLLKKILRGQFPIDKYIVTKTLKAEYKNRNSVAHAVLADRIGIRTPGNKPEMNDRIPYVYIVPKGKVLLQGDRVEDPKYVLENGLELDYLFYITNQIMKPSIQFLELIAENPKKLFQNYINKEINRRKNVSSILEYVNEKNQKNEEYDELEELEKELEKELKETNVKKQINKKTAQELDEELEEKFTFNFITDSNTKLNKKISRKSKNFKNVDKDNNVKTNNVSNANKPSLTIEL